MTGVRAAVRENGDEKLEQLYLRRYGHLVRLAWLLGGERSPAEEIVQDAFVQLLRRGDAVTNPEAYLRIAVVHGVQSWGRRRALEQRHPVQIDEAQLDADGLAVRAALGVLSPRQRAAVVLRYFEDLPEAEIATALDCRPGTVKSLLSRSMAKLKEALHDD